MDKISIPKLRIKSLKNPKVALLVKESGGDEPPQSTLKNIHYQINTVYDMIVTEATEDINYVVLMWDVADIDHVGMSWGADDFSPMFLFPEFVKDAVTKSMYHRSGLETSEEE